jgi:hypothetical protein
MQNTFFSSTKDAKKREENSCKSELAPGHSLAAGLYPMKPASRFFAFFAKR